MDKKRQPELSHANCPRSMGTGSESQLAGKKSKYDYPAGLTPREVEVLALIATGMTNAEIAEKLFISPHTVKNHVSNIYKKIHAEDRTQIALWALSCGFVARDSPD